MKLKGEGNRTNRQLNANQIIALVDWMRANKDRAILASYVVAEAASKDLGFPISECSILYFFEMKEQKSTNKELLKLYQSLDARLTLLENALK